MASISSSLLETQSVTRTGKGGEQGPRFKRLRKKYQDSDEDESPEGDPGASDGESSDCDGEDFVDPRTRQDLGSEDDGPFGELVPLLSFRWIYDPAADTEAATSPAYPTHEQAKARLALEATLRGLITTFKATVDTAFNEGLIVFEDEEV